MKLEVHLARMGTGLSGNKFEKSSTFVGLRRIFLLMLNIYSVYWA